MKIKKLKRISALALSLMLASMTGCRSGSSQETEHKKQSQSPIELIQNSEYGYKTECIEIQKKAEALSDPALIGNTLYFTNITGGYEGCQLQSVDLSAPEEIKTYDSFLKGEDYVQSLRFLHANIDGGITFLQILFSRDTENAEYDNNVYDNNVYNNNVYNNNVYDGTYHLIRLNADGNVISDVDVTRYFKYQIFLYGVYDTTKLYVYVQPMPGAETILDTETTEQGSCFMLVIDCETGEGEKTEIDYEPSALISLYSGDIAAVVYDIWTGKNTIRLWDKEEKSFSKQEVDFSDNTFHEIYPAYEDKFYYIDSSTGILSLYDLSEQKTEQALKLLDWDVPLLSASLVSYIDSDHMFVIGGREVYRLTRVKASELEQKTEILLGCLGSFEYSESIAEFNRKHSKYKIVIKNYIPEDKEYEEIDFDEAVSLLTRDILTGNAPDLIDLSGIDYARYSGSGMFEDLYPYIRQDEEFQNRNLNQTILKLFEEDGALYALPSGYKINALASEKQTLGEEPFTLEQYLKISEADSEKKLFQRISRKRLLSTLFAYNEDYLIDYKAKTCNFTDGVFEKILMIAKEHPSYENEDDVINEYKDLKKLASDKQILFYPMAFLDFSDIISEYQCLEKIFDDEFRITGYPSVEGDKVGAFVAGSLYAISSLSQHKEVCWEFIKQTFGLSNERAEFQRLSAFSVDNDVLEAYFEELKSENAGYYDTGEPRPVSLVDGVFVYAPTDEDIREIRNLINRVDTLIPNRYEGDIYKILAEEAEGFYAGDKTAEEVCKVIQSRVNILINEN